MLKDYPDHHDAEIVMRVYEMRREPVLRESRAALAMWWPGTLEDVMALIKSDHPLNAPFRQVQGYWEMVYSMVKHRIVDADFFIENNGEGMFFFAKVAPFLDQIRTATSSPKLFGNAEWIENETELGRQIFQRMSARAQMMRDAKKA